MCHFLKSSRVDVLRFPVLESDCLCFKSASTTYQELCNHSNLFNLCVPHILHLKNRDAAADGNNACHTGLLQGLNELIHIKHLEQPSVCVNYYYHISSFHEAFGTGMSKKVLLDITQPNDFMVLWENLKAQYLEAYRNNPMLSLFMISCFFFMNGCLKGNESK